MRTILALTLVSLVVGVAMAGAASSSSFKATLNGKADKTTSKGTGSATFKISSTGKSISYTLKASGLTGPVTAAHIHLGKAGVNGPVIVAICPKACKLPKSGTLSAKQFVKAPGVASFAAAIKKIKAGGAYANVHTAKFPAGEIRGQVKAG
jgi:Cu/Zn superoxide dismutase